MGRRGFPHPCGTSIGACQLRCGTRRRCHQSFRRTPGMNEANLLLHPVILHPVISANNADIFTGNIHWLQKHATTILNFKFHLHAQLKNKLRVSTTKSQTAPSRCLLAIPIASARQSSAPLQPLEPPLSGGHHTC